MSILRNPFDHTKRLTCSCGQHHSQEAHDAAEALSLEASERRVLETAVMRAVFPKDVERRRFLQVVGAGAAASIFSSIFPFDCLQAIADDKKPLEKKDLKVGFIPITCGAPIIMAH